MKRKISILLLAFAAFSGCFINTEEGKCRRDVKIEQVDEADTDPCGFALLYQSLGDERKNTAKEPAMRGLASYYASWCIKLELDKAACGKESNILPALQEIRGDM